MLARQLFLAVLFAAAAFSQVVTASLEGVVRDSTGAVIPNAAVQIVNVDTNASTTLHTGAEGRYLAPSLSPGRYSVTVEASGFKKLEQSGIALDVNQAAQLNAVLEVGAVTETVKVSGEAELLQTATSSLGQVIDNAAIVNLPLNQRNAYSLVFLAPGVVGNVTYQFNGVNISINGGRPGSNEILVDGIPSSPPLVNPIQGFSVFPSVDAVQEFKVQTNNYSAEFGRSGGGIINLVYKSGGNSLHGSLFEFLRNSKLDANDFFSNTRGIALPSFKRNQFGASAGGPVLLPKLYDGRNRTFFYATYEGLQQRSATNLITTVPTALERQGDFSQTRNASGAVIRIYDPVTTALTGAAFIRQPFAGNAIPASRIDPVAKNVMRYYPLPNNPGDPITGANNYVVPSTAPTNANQIDLKMDEIINDRNRFFARYSHKNYNVLPANQFPADIAIAQGGSSQFQRYNNAAFDYTWTPAPTYLLDFRYGFGRVAFPIVPRSDGFDPTQLGFPSYIQGGSDRLMFPSFAPDGYLAIGNGGPDFRKNGSETHTATLSNTKIFSAHTIKFGFEARLIRVNDLEAGMADGNFTFSRSFTQGPDANQASNAAGNGVASLLLGIGSGTLTKAFKDVATESTYWAWYIADDWKVTSRLTLNLGLRYELEVPRTERYNRINVFDPAVPSPLAQPSGLPNLRGGLEFVNVNGLGRRQFETDKNNFAPRFGFSYQLTGNTVLRGGYGIFFAPSLRAAGGTVGNTGYRTDIPYTGSLDGVTPANYLSNPFPGGIPPIPGNSQGLLTGAGGSISATLRGDNVVPYMQNWNFNVQRQFAKQGLLIEAAYVGTHGVHLNQSGEGDYNLNQLRPEQLALGTQLQQQVANPFFGLIATGPLSSAKVPLSFLLRNYPQFTTVFALYDTGASSVYHSFQLKVEKRFSSGLNLLLSYTGAKLIDDFSIISNVGRTAGLQNIYDRHADRSVSPNDVSRIFNLSSVYELPFGKGKRFGSGWNRVMDSALGGWQMNGILTLQTGYPLVITTQNTSNSGSNTLRPNNNGHSAALSGSIESRLKKYFDTSVFSQPAPFTFGNTGRTLPDVRGPGVKNVDFSLFKNFRLIEKASLQFRAEAFNSFNTPQFGFPNQNLNAVQFGQISTQANAPRQIQFGLKLLF